MRILKYLSAMLIFLFMLPMAQAECHFFPIFYCTLDREGKAPGDDCASKTPFFLSYQLKKGERTYTFRKDCGADWGQNAWNIIIMTTATWKSDGTVKQVAAWSGEADHPLMTSTVTGTCKTDPWLDPNAVCTKKESHNSVSSSLIGQNGMPDILYALYMAAIEENAKDPFPNTSTLISAEKRKEISMKVTAQNIRDHMKKLPPPIPLPK